MQVYWNSPFFPNFHQNSSSFFITGVLYPHYSMKVQISAMQSLIHYNIPRSKHPSVQGKSTKLKKIFTTLFAKIHQNYHSIFITKVLEFGISSLLDESPNISQLKLNPLCHIHQWIHRSQSIHRCGVKAQSLKNLHHVFAKFHQNYHSFVIRSGF